MIVEQLQAPLLTQKLYLMLFINGSGEEQKKLVGEHNTATLRDLTNLYKRVDIRLTATLPDGTVVIGPEIIFASKITPVNLILAKLKILKKVFHVQRELLERSSLYGKFCSSCF